MDLRTVKTTLIGDRAFYRRVLAILIPLIIQNTVTNVVSLLDNVMVGRIGTLPMSAVAIVNQLMFVFNLCVFGGLAGAGIFAAQFAGAKDDDGVRHCFRLKWYLAAVMLVVAFGVFLSLPERLISLYLAEGTAAADAEATMRYGLTYLRIMLVGLVPFGVSQVYSSTLRELGETKVPMIASVAAILVNLVFNYILIFGSEGLPFVPLAPMGVAGAAIATVLSRFVEAAIVLVFTHTRSSRFAFIRGAYSSPRVPKALCLSVAKKGVPLLINEFLWSSGMATLLQCYSVRGLDVVAASNIASTINNLFNVVFMSMGNAISIIIGQHLGANELGKAKSSLWRLIALSIATSFVVCFVMFLSAPFLPNIYNTTDAVREMATGLLRVTALVTPLMVFSFSAYFTLRAGGKTLITMFFDCGFAWLMCVPLAYCLAHFTDMPIIPLYACVQLLDMVKCVAGFILLKKGVWLNNIIE